MIPAELERAIVQHPDENRHRFGPTNRLQILELALKESGQFVRSQLRLEQSFHFATLVGILQGLSHGIGQSTRLSGLSYLLDRLRTNGSQGDLRCFPHRSVGVRQEVDQTRNSGCGTGVSQGKRRLSANLHILILGGQ